MLNGLTAHKILKKSSIEAYNSIHDYDFICISETYLDSSVSLDDKDIAIEGYNIAVLIIPAITKSVVYAFFIKNHLHYS